MLAYFGGKLQYGDKISRAITDFIIHEIDPSISSHFTLFLDCFLGMGGVSLPMLSCMPRSVSFIGSDIDRDVIGLWKHVQKGWRFEVPIRKRLFEELKNTREIRSPLHIVVGYATGFQRKYFSRNWNNDKEMQSYLLSAQNRLLKAQKILSDHGSRVSVTARDYRDYTVLMQEFPLFSVIVYVDPPYQKLQTKSNLTRHFTHFDRNEFWNFMRMWSLRQVVFISEYSAPPDFVCIWSCARKHHTCETFSDRLTFKKYKTEEKLFIYKPLKDFLKH